jgi:hypothetical protein
MQSFAKLPDTCPIPFRPSFLLMVSSGIPDEIQKVYFAVSLSPFEPHC